MCCDTDVYLHNNGTIKIEVNTVKESDGIQKKKPDDTVVFPRNCNICGDGIPKGVKALGLHMLKHNPFDPKPYKCPDCDRKFAEIRKVHTHIRSAHEDPNDLPSWKKFQCEFCERRYKREEHLLLHIDHVHSSELVVDVQQKPKTNHIKCRICLIDILKTGTRIDDKLCNIFISCTGIDVRNCLEISSSWICELCGIQLFNFYNFQKKCWESDIILRLNTSMTIQDN